MTVNQELQIMRTFDVPKETLFNMWTQPNHLKHWWAPIGFTVEINKYRVGVRRYFSLQPNISRWSNFVG
ncbi:SRPBCC domain-containing protein [Paenisporosarcina sp. OV554]|uniref:SRPBCC domain-containing protein n=1 Tax=Paenisporosarcina sp. OV554 TaxID=2135694 RepID=UPI000D4660E6|nr:SRPBCC domain-containing protein [Paenisporosarcina sp. OV554]PUB10936.1 activator of Hsp90 ATPase-like protein [Paenisporosarcina sp. OV554]